VVSCRNSGGHWALVYTAVCKYHLFVQNAVALYSRCLSKDRSNTSCRMANNPWHLHVYTAYTRWPTVPVLPGQSRFEAVCPGVPKAAFGTKKCPGLVWTAVWHGGRARRVNTRNGAIDDRSRCRSARSHRHIVIVRRPWEKWLITITFNRPTKLTRLQPPIQWRKPGPQFGRMKKKFCCPLKFRNLGGRRETHCFLELNN